MAQVADFSPEQIKEAQDWYMDNYPVIVEAMSRLDKDVTNALYGTYFDLKMISKELRPNQFIIGVDYMTTGSYESDLRAISEDKIAFNLSFWNPHAKGVADRLAKEFLMAQLSKL